MLTYIMAFNWQTYLDNYPDLRHAGILTEMEAITHWNNNGMYENRTDKPIKTINQQLYLIDWQEYISKYPDLQAAGITTDKDAWTHWLNHGSAEGRIITPINKQLSLSNNPITSSYRAINTQDTHETVKSYRPVESTIEKPKYDLLLINWQEYIQQYPDLQAAGLITDEDAYNHWLNCGSIEDRIIVPTYPLVLPEVSEYVDRPNVIYQRWHTKNLPPHLINNVIKMKEINVGCTYELFDNNDCRNFIMKEFPPHVLYTYDSLVPDSYKEDLWKYCILYIYGGVYQDIHFAPVDLFSFYNIISDKQYFCYNTDKNTISTAVMICLPGNIIMKNCIEAIYLNVLTKMYGKSEVDPTGSTVIGKFIKKEDCALNYSQNSVYYNDIELLHNASKLQGTEESAKLWKSNKIYANMSLNKYIK